MGQLCSFCGSQEEFKKSTAFSDSHDDQNDGNRSSSHRTQTPETSESTSHNHPTSSSHNDPNNNNVNSSSNNNNTNSDEPIIDEEERTRRLKQYALEQAELSRRDSIVNAASTSMVPVNGNGGGSSSQAVGLNTHHHPPRQLGGIYTYYDPAIAAAAAQDILNSAARTGGLDIREDDAARSARWVDVVGTLPRGVPGDTEKNVMDALSKGRWDDVRLGSRENGAGGCGGEDPEYFLDDLAEDFLESMVPTRTNLFAGCPSVVENLL